MLTFSAPTNWDNQLLDHYASLSVREVFGSLASAPIGSGRARLTLPQVDKDKAKRHVEYAHSKNISFNFSELLDGMYFL